MPRVTPVSDKSQVAAEHQSIADEVIKVFGGLRGPHSILMLRPPLDQKVLAVGNHFRYDALVKPQEGELAIITAARERDCGYVWAAHVNAGRRAGVREEAITAVREKKAPAGLTPDEAAIVTYVQQLFRTNRVEQAAFDALKNKYGVEWLVELTTLAGYYGMLAGVVNAFEVQAAPEGDKLPV